MGGNALSHVTVRLPRRKADRLAAECVDQLLLLYPGRRVVHLAGYRDKPDAGDADLLIEADERYQPDIAAAVLGAVEVVRNGPVTSVGLVVRPEIPQLDGNVFQVDLIRMEPAGFDFALSYFGHGDTGNLLGRLFHAAGLTLRHDGLYYYLRDGDYKFRELLLTRDFSLALAFMGYDPRPLGPGFADARESFEYVASSPFFNPDIFLLENRNAKSRVRDRKRPAYMGFLRWCEGREGLARYPYPADKSAWLPRIEEFFPHFGVEYARALADLTRLRAVKAKFNGAWVSQLTGLQGKELGVLMRRFKASFETPQALQEFVLRTSTDELEARVRQFQTEAVA